MDGIAGDAPGAIDKFQSKEWYFWSKFTEFMPITIICCNSQQFII